MNINQAYEFVKNLANKDQRGGFLSPSEFESFAREAQLSVLRKRMRRLPFSGFPVDEIPDDVLPLLTLSNPIAVPVSLKAPWPVDCYRVAAITSSYEGAERNVDILTYSEFTFRKSSTIAPPTLEDPICTVYDKFVQFAPALIGSVVYTYIRKPKQPVWKYDVSGTQMIFQPTGSVDFELPEDLHGEICLRIAAMFGVKISNELLLQYSLTQEQLVE